MSQVEIAAAMMSALLSNPNVVEYKPDCGWGPCNCTWAGLAEHAVFLSRELLHQIESQSEKKP